MICLKYELEEVISQVMVFTQSIKFAVEKEIQESVWDEVDAGLRSLENVREHLLPEDLPDSE
jgi:hypothetical protein